MSKWVEHRTLILEIFVIANLSFLAVDIFVAHSTNGFRHWAEWIPFYFSLIAPIFLIIETVRDYLKHKMQYKLLGYVVGYLSVIIGVAGLIYHLHDTFFQHQTIKSLVYTAPFVAPLAYTGLGCLLIMNRIVKDNKVEWSQWLIFIALGGFFGNFVLALADHAQNGFFSISEWIPVISSAIAVSFLSTALLRKSSASFMDICLYIMGGQVVVGLLGFYFHGVAVSEGLANSFFENLVYAAPIFAPLLFVNLAILAVLGILGVRSSLIEAE